MRDSLGRSLALQEDTAGPLSSRRYRKVATYFGLGKVAVRRHDEPCACLALSVGIIRPIVASEEVKRPSVVGYVLSGIHARYGAKDPGADSLSRDTGSWRVSSGGQQSAHSAEQMDFSRSSWVKR